MELIPEVSIIILNHNNPKIINKCLTTMQITEGVTYEVVVVDNGSNPETVRELRQHAQEGRIDTLVESPVNTFFSEGNNIGVQYSNPRSKYILMLNSDVAFKRSDWLSKMLEWMNGVPEYHPWIWDFNPTVPSPGPRDVISYGWSHDASVEPGHVRPEGWCCLFRRPVWQYMSTDFPWHYGFEEMVARIARDGTKVGVLFNYPKYLIHREGGSGKAATAVSGNEYGHNRRPDIPGWFKDVYIETLDFTLGPDERDTYLEW